MKIGILGHFGIGETLLNGQTIKTNNLVDGLERYGNAEIVKVDSHGWTKHPVRLINSIKSAFQKCEAVIMLPAHNGVKVFAPILLHYKKKYNKKIFYDVIGGWLPEFLKDKEKLSNTLKHFDGIWVETNTMKEKLELQGFKNIAVVPNFKELKPLAKDNLVCSTGIPYRLCTFSRVMKEKGIETAVKVIKQVNEYLGYTAYSLDIYGQVDSEQIEWFKRLKDDFPSCVQYCGCVNSDKSVEVLKDYFALLFPTYYEGEGFAGTLIDAYSAGVPVIASDWRYNPELVHEKTGFVYPVHDDDSLINILIKLAKEPDMLLSKKLYCLEEAEKYKVETVIGQLLTML